MKVLVASSEAAPFAKTGGLADAVGCLMKGLRAGGVDARLVMPLYRSVRRNFPLKYTGTDIKVAVGGRKYASRVFSYEGRVCFVECGEFFDRQELYGTPAGDYGDNAHRFIFFSRAALEVCDALGFSPDIVHCHDWQTGLVPLYMKTAFRRHFAKTPSLFTIHNLGYQGLFPASAMPLTGLGSEYFTPERIEFYGQVNFLKAGIVAGSAISTVSMTYAREILTAEYGFGLDGVLRSRQKDLTGILNGIDHDEWDPEKDASINQNYRREDISGKKACKERLLKECGLKTKGPLLGAVGRLSAQKGVDVLLGSIDRIVSEGAGLVLLGKGDSAFEDALKAVSGRHKGKVFFKPGYDEAFAHRVYAGSDILLMPSRYEPCGLSQMIALRYGAVPVARRTGGLADTIEDYAHLKGRGTGFLFSDYTPGCLKESVKRALCIYADAGKWKRLVLEGMGKDFSWETSVEKYISLYESLLRRAKR